MAIGKVLLASLVFFAGHWKPLLKAVLAPVVVSALLLHALAWVPVIFLQLVFVLVDLCVQTLIAVTVHRYALLGPGAVPEWGLLRWSRRETAYLLRTVVMALCLLPCVLLVAIPTLGWVIAPLAACWIGGRISLMFPACSLDHDATMARAWALSGSHQVPMVLATVTFPLLSGALDLLLVEAPVLGLLSALVGILSLVLAVIALSFAYLEVVRLQRPDEGAAA